MTGAEVADGVDECVKAVRRQIGAGADWIKVRLGLEVNESGVTISVL